MVSIPEVMTWIISVFVLYFGFMQYRYLRRLPQYTILALSYGAMVVSWTLTILEGFFWEKFLNALEHGFASLSVFLLAAWCFLVVQRMKNNA